MISSTAARVCRKEGLPTEAEPLLLVARMAVRFRNDIWDLQNDHLGVAAAFREAGIAYEPAPHEASGLTAEDLDAVTLVQIPR